MTNTFRCSICNKLYKSGTMVIWDSKSKTKVMVCISCHAFMKVSKTKYALNLADYVLKMKKKK